MIRIAPILMTQAPPAGGGPTLVDPLFEFHANEGIDDTGPQYEWEDQSGNGHDLIQPTAARQASDAGDDGWLHSGGFPVNNFYFSGATALGPMDIENAFTKLVRFRVTTDWYGHIWSTENYCTFRVTGTGVIQTTGGQEWTGRSFNTWYNVAHTYDGVDAHQLISLTDGPSSSATVEDTATSEIINYGGTGQKTWVGSGQEEYIGMNGNISHLLGFESVLTSTELQDWVNTF